MPPPTSTPKPNNHTSMTEMTGIANTQAQTDQINQPRTPSLDNQASQANRSKSNSAQGRQQGAGLVAAAVAGEVLWLCAWNTGEERSRKRARAAAALQGLAAALLLLVLCASLSCASAQRLVVRYAPSQRQQARPLPPSCAAPFACTCLRGDGSLLR